MPDAKKDSRSTLHVYANKLGFFSFPFHSSVRSDCHMFNPTANTWDVMESMSPERYRYGLVQLAQDSFWISGKHLQEHEKHLFFISIYVLLVQKRAKGAINSAKKSAKSANKSANKNVYLGI